ncbi:hypothetical protein BP5796_01330 [Coleophoma crateriformis]|uniref:Protein kinase domain-containing protein n=1 Tax=Coleophoma crateriformis TaxID=565419 RepID=A0A3D8T057_9HELO|nr:hypothetical protein BP5796_01330 [Coleophoma crateriformis]
MADPFLRELRRLRDELDDSLSLRTDLDKRFLRAARAGEILNKDRLQQLFSAAGTDVRLRNQLIKDISSPKGGYLNVLATLIFGNCIEALQDISRWGLFGFREATDDDLPFSDELLQRLSIKDTEAQIFSEYQYIFYPIIIRARSVEEAIYDERCRLPITSHTPLGKGAFGVVDKVTIEANHIELIEPNQNSPFVNSTPATYARKTFEVKDSQAFIKERRALRVFLNARKKHDNIMNVMASLRIGEQYSLFFDVADCDLWVYLENKAMPRSTEHKLKAQLLQCCCDIVGALDFLHRQLKDDDGNPIRCFHLDIKPHNILVMHRDSENMKWKLTDFGISEFEYKPRDQTSGRVTSEKSTGKVHLDELFAERESVSYRARPFQGTFAPPETDPKMESREPRCAANDIWSFGCVLVLVLGFIFKQGAPELLDYLRAFKPEDTFYVIEERRRLNRTPECVPKLDPSVLRLFNELPKKIPKDRKADCKMCGSVIKVLTKNILLPKYEDRSTAEKLKPILGKIVSKYKSSESLAKGPGSKASSSPWEEVTETFQLGPRDSDSFFRISPGSNFLAWTTNSKRTIQLFSLAGLVTGKGIPGWKLEPRVYTIPNDLKSTWHESSVSQNWICASVRSDDPVHIFYQCASSAGVDNRPRYLHLTSQLGHRHIQAFALSAKDSYFACVGTDSHGNDGKVYLFHMQTVLKRTKQDSNFMNYQPRMSVVSSSSSDSLALPRENLLPSNASIEAGHEIVTLAFTCDEKYLTLVSYKRGSKENKFMINVWATSERRMLIAQPIVEKNQGPSNIPFNTTSCVLDDPLTAVVLLFRNIFTKGKFIENQQYWEPMQYSAKPDLTDIFPSSKPRQMICVRSDLKKKEVRMASISVDLFNLQIEKNLAKKFITGNIGPYNPSTDCRCVLEHDGKTFVLFATIKPSIHLVEIADDS